MVLFFATIIFGFGDNIIAGLTATTVAAVAAVTRFEKEKESEKENNIEEGKG